MGLMNRDAYSVQHDRLIYDGKIPIDIKNIVVSITASTNGVIKRGQVIDVAAGTFSLHAASGAPSCIAAQDTEYAADDSEVVVPCYISGNFHTGGVIADPALTDTDVETLRTKNIILK